LSGLPLNGSDRLDYYSNAYADAIYEECTNKLVNTFVVVMPGSGGSEEAEEDGEEEEEEEEEDGEKEKGREKEKEEVTVKKSRKVMKKQKWTAALRREAIKRARQMTSVMTIKLGLARKLAQVTQNLGICLFDSL
jgi:hypothetical protein